MLDRVYVNEVLADLRELELQERERRRRRHGVPPEERRRVAVWAGRVFLRIGALLYGWGCRRNVRCVTVVLLPERAVAGPGETAGPA
ncbi:MAG TPA: hypothetical protein VIO14_01930 [Dehalococcoidia bacterium]